MNEHDPEIEPRKVNRRRSEARERLRPVVHGALAYLGHRPRPKDERRRLARIVSNARKRVR
jgi:hypothetical protein